jgi:SAM-dependent methyltransferase
VTQPGSATAFEALVDDYDAARPTYPSDLYEGMAGLDGGRVLELGAGTGLATPGLLARAASVTCSDLGPRMLGRLVSKLAVPSVVARAEALPFLADSFDLVFGAQMWHWTEAAAPAEVVRVLRPGGCLVLAWNEVDPSAGGPAFSSAWDRQQTRLEAGNKRYTRGYRDRDYGSELMATGLFASAERWEGSWQRELDWPTYERWLRSKSYVDALPDVEAFLAAEQASLLEAFSDGRILEPFRVVRWTLRPAP